MFSCNINIIVVSNSRRIEDMILDVNLPVDCNINVRTEESLNSDINCLDCAVIFDGIQTVNDEINYIGENCKAILVTEAGELSKIDSDLKSLLSDIWVVPSEQDAFITIIQFYSLRLIEQMKESFDYRIQSICINTAFDSIPDLVWFKDVRGAHLMVNNGFCDAVDKTKEQIYKRGHYYIWDIPQDEYEQGDYVCLESEEVVMKARETCLFDEKVKTKSGMKKFKTYKSPLIDNNGNIFGTCGIAKDVTSLHNIESELKVILDSMPFAVLVENDNGKVISVNSNFYKYFPDYKDIADKSLDRWRNEVLDGHQNDKEITVKLNDNEYILLFFEKPIFNIFNEIIGRVIILNDITEARKNHQQTLYNANTDFLTGVSNRRNLFSHLNKIKHTPRLTLITVDLDNFKKVNDTYGHHEGDKALVETVKLTQNFFKDDFVARLGGDEFLIVTTRECEISEIEKETKKYIEMLKNHYMSNPKFSAMGASAGVAMSVLGDKKEHNFEELMKHSDAALYNAKNFGKGKCCVYSE